MLDNEKQTEGLTLNLDLDWTKETKSLHYLSSQAPAKLAKFAFPPFLRTAGALHRPFH